MRAALRPHRLDFRGVVADREHHPSHLGDQLPVSGDDLLVARRLQPVSGQEVVEVVPGRQSGHVERAEYVSVFATDPSSRQGSRSSVVAVALAGAAAVRGDGVAAPGGDDLLAGADQAAGRRPGRGRSPTMEMTR